VLPTLKAQISTAHPYGERIGHSEIAEARGDLSCARRLARTWAATISEARRREQASAFAMRALLGYAASARPESIVGAGAVDFNVALDDTAAELARSIGCTAAKLSQLEALHYITSLYPALLPERYRAAAGAFYTPPSLAARLLDQSEEAGLEWHTAKVLDPAAGGGAFLVHAATRMLVSLRDCEPRFALRQLKNRLHGLELDPHAAALAQVSLEVVIADITKAAAETPPTFVRVCDALEAAPKAIYDLVVGNPPYGRVTLPEETRQRYARSLYGHANLYGVFTDVALRWARKGGLVAYLTPTSFLSGQYYSSLRDLLVNEAPPVVIDFVHARTGVFEDVLQETLLAVYRKGGKLTRPRINHLTVESEVAAKVKTNGTVGLPIPASRPWIAPRSPEHSELIAQLERMTTGLSDWGYSVSTGPLVWNRHKTQLREGPGTNTRPLVWAESVTVDGRFLFRAQKRSHAPHFEVGPEDSWLVVTEPCVLVQRTTAKEQPRRLVAAEMPLAFVKEHRGVVVENHLNMIKPSGEPKVSPTVLAAFLNSSVADAVFRCMSGSVAVSAFELEALALPSADDLTSLVRLVAKGATRLEIDAECRRLYGLRK
jgi:adenine-specific DNA-methyltransferase